MNKYIIIFLLMMQNLFSVGVAAGTEIKNRAYLDYVVESITMKSQSNELIDVVDQKLDMQMVCQESTSVVVEPDDKKRAMRFMLTNNGNGEDSYLFTHIEGEAINFSVSNREIYRDNGNGVFSIVDDTLITELILQSDEAASLFLVSDIPTSAKSFSENGLKANSLIQGSLVYGESKRLDSFYAVVASEEASMSAFCTYAVPNIVLELEKSTTLSSDKLYKGTTIHYVIDVKAIGIGTLQNVVVKDYIPEGTVYLEESLKLDGVPVDGFDGRGIFVSINSISQKIESTDVLHRVSFDVKVK